MNEPIALAVYKKKDYQKILQLCADRNSMPETWEDWQKTKKKALKNLLKYEVETIDVVISPDDLKKFCKKNDLRIDKNARSVFISKIISSK